MFSHVTHIILNLLISMFIPVCLLCAIHFHSVAKEKCYFVQSSYYIPAKMTQNHSQLLSYSKKWWAVVF